METLEERTRVKIKSIIADDLDANIEPDNIKDDISLYDDGLGLDSISIINLIVLLEKRFEIDFEESEISADHFSSVNSLVKFVSTKLASVNNTP